MTGALHHKLPAAMSSCGCIGVGGPVRKDGDGIAFAVSEGQAQVPEKKEQVWQRFIALTGVVVG